jgi:hypothetical protein
MTKRAGRAERHKRVYPKRAAFVVVAGLLLGIIALLPFALAGVVADVDHSANPTFEIMSDYHDEGTTHSHVNLSVTNLDEWQRYATIQVSGHHVCATTCTWSDRVLLVSIPDSAEDGEGLPPYAAVSFAPGAKEITQSIRLPVSGDAIRYPFDRYGLELGVIMQRVYEDGRVETLSPAEAPGHLFLSVNGSIPRAVMDRPVSVELSKVFVDDPAYQYVNVTRLTFSRPVYLQILTVFLVLLISAAATYAVFMRPLHELVLNSGALVLGVWGIRAILLGAAVAGFTVVDLSLMIVILFLLAAITARALWFLHDRGEPPEDSSTAVRRDTPQAASAPSHSDGPHR